MKSVSLSKHTTQLMGVGVGGCDGGVIQRVAHWSPRSSVLCVSQRGFAGSWLTDESARLLK